VCVHVAINDIFLMIFMMTMSSPTDINDILCCVSFIRLFSVNGNTILSLPTASKPSIRALSSVDANEAKPRQACDIPDTCSTFLFQYKPIVYADIKECVFVFITRHYGQLLILE